MCTEAFACIRKAASDFQIGWYNDQVSDLFKFTLPYDTLAAVIISTPSMFERSFLPCVKTAESSERDPIDECTRREMMAVKEVTCPALFEVMRHKF